MLLAKSIIVSIIGDLCNTVKFNVYNMRSLYTYLSVASVIDKSLEAANKQSAIIDPIVFMG